MASKFYMIFVEGGNTPAVKHSNYKLAEIEAKRLAEVTGKKAYILCTVRSFEVNKFVVEDIIPDEVKEDIML